MKLKYNPPEKLDKLVNMSANMLSSVLEIIEDQDAFVDLWLCIWRATPPAECIARDIFAVFTKKSKQ